ncbi:imm11 family protein [Hahella chejuensis]|uniref:imm11 family protein n=1 Tax=Hahella chejuensis TaxID=158327 RepID=UPI001EE4837E|nr:DUF1629 domain-containing protein [Hahella chejuensis]
MDDEGLVVLDHSPVGIGAHYSRLRGGKSVKDYYPENAVVHMSEDREGLKLASLIGSTESYLILHKDVKAIIESRIGNDNIEYFPFTLLNHKNKPHTGDYFFINPLTIMDCLDTKASQVKYWRDTDKVIDIGEYILDTQKVENAPAIFRVKEHVSSYIISEELVNDFIQAGFTNLIMTKLKYSDDT